MIGQVEFKRLLVFSTIVSTTTLLAARAYADLAIAAYEDRLHDPFYVGSDKDFIGAGYNWSGYGRWEDPVGTSSNWKQVTMISDNYFLTANHNKPVRADDPAGAAPKVRFYRTTDPNGEYWESEIAIEAGAYKGTQIESTDLWVGKLANTPPSWVTRYPLAKRHEATNYLSYTDNELFIFGQDSPRSATSVRVGRNEINFVNSSGTYQWDYDPTAGFDADETQTQSGDSGGPSFFGGGTVPTLAGIHYRVDLDTGVSKNLHQIMDAVDEPISFATGLLGDVNADFRVNALDMHALLRNFGKSKGAQFYEGDVNGDGRINTADLYIWVNNRGRSFFAPSDFDHDGIVNVADLATIGDHWLKSTPGPFAMGDANGDSFVDFADVEIFDRNQFRTYFGPLPAPLAPVSGDLTGNGIVDGLDINMVALNIYQSVVPGTNGDADGNGYVNDADSAYVTVRLGDSFGDVSGDHLVGPADFVILASNWNRAVSGGRLAGDLNEDGRVNGLDARALFGWWSQKGSTFPGMTVPEPSTATMFVIGALLAAVAGRRRSPASRPAAYFSRAMSR